MGYDEIEMNPESINTWCDEGWVDLRPDNFKSWQDRITQIMNQTESLPTDDTSSRYTYNMDYWENFETIDEGKIIGWVFEYEDKGWRFKR